MTVANIADLLHVRAERQFEDTAFVFLADGETESATWSFGELDRRARVIAAQLRDSGMVHGDRVLLPCPPGLEFIAAFFGCLYAGGVAVPVYPPHPRRIERGAPRFLTIARDCSARFALTTGGLMPAVTRMLAGDQRSTQVMTIGLDRPMQAEIDGPELTVNSDDLALLQYTSGSTGVPKGVMVSHANLLHNLAMGAEMGHRDSDCAIVSWLPTYHDLGLIGVVLHAVHVGAKCVLMPPWAFLHQPLHWLRAIDRYRGRTSAAPNFGYEWCLRQIPPGAEDGLDLSCWDVAMNGSEPIRASTLQAFARRFAARGFRAEAFCLGYGLAESTLLVSGSSPGTGPIVRQLDGLALDRGDVVDAEAPSAREIVGCGSLWSDRRVEIVDPETGVTCPPDRIGEIWVSGADVAQGYWGRAEESHATFGARLTDGAGPFLRTGDLGFLRDGQLYVTGRIKDLIIISGQNHYPQDIETTAESAHPAVRFGGVAAFAVTGDDGERPVVVAEVERDLAGDTPEAVTESIARAVAREHHLQIQELVLVRAGGVPKTPSGKVRRSTCREALLGGHLEHIIHRST